MQRKCTAGACARDALPNTPYTICGTITRLLRIATSRYTVMLRLNAADDEAFLNKLWFQKWVCDWRGWDADMRRLRRVLDAHSTKGFCGRVHVAFYHGAYIFLNMMLCHALVLDSNAFSLQFHPLPAVGAHRCSSCTPLLPPVVSSPSCFLPSPSRP
jgi:hypothetical protein